MGVGKSTFAFTNASITLNGGSTTINITRDNQSYSHKLSHGYGTIATLAVGTTSYTWTPTADSLADFFKEIPNQKTRLIDVYLDTYNGSTLVGRDVHALTVTLSETTGKPTVSGFAITDGNTVTNGMGIIVDGKSSLTVSKTVAAKYGSSITKTVYAFKQKEYTDIADLIASLPLTTTPTRCTIACVATDSRGFTASAVEEKLFASYEAPTVDTFEVVRCDADGNETEIGTKAKAIVKGSWRNLSGKNAATFKIGYKTSAATEYTYQTIAVSGGTVNVEQILSATFDAYTDYVFSVSLADAFTTYVESEKDFANSKNIIYVSADGEELSFDATTINIGKKNATINFAGAKATIKFTKEGGNETLKISSNNSKITFEKDEEDNEYINIYTEQSNSGLGGNVNIMNGSIIVKDIDARYINYEIPVNSLDCNNAKTNGKYYLANGSTNRPVDKNGWLEVMTYSTDYVHQRYITYDGITYERMMQAGTWTSWKCLDYSAICVFLSANAKMTQSAAKMTLGNLTAKAGTFLSQNSGGVKCARAGIVMVNFGAVLGDGFSDDDLFHVQLYKNSSMFVDIMHRVGSGGWDSAPATGTLVPVSANDVLYLYCYNQSAARGNLYKDNRQTAMAVRYVN